MDECIPTHNSQNKVHGSNTRCEVAIGFHWHQISQYLFLRVPTIKKCLQFKSVLFVSILCLCSLPVLKHSSSLIHIHTTKTILSIIVRLNAYSSPWCKHIVNLIFFIIILFPDFPNMNLIPLIYVSVTSTPCLLQLIIFLELVYARGHILFTIIAQLPSTVT